MSTDTFESVTAAWLKEQDHIGDSHPLAFSVMQAAKQLDIKNTIALYKEYNSLMKHLEALKPEQAVEKKVDPLLSVVTGLEKRDA